MARLGRQTPTQSYVLPYTKTYGPDAAVAYNRTGRTAQKWQENILADILAVNDDGLYVHTKYGFSVPRRNGKNEIVLMRELYGLTERGEHIIHTAHRTTTSHSAFERLSAALDDAGYVEKQDYTATRQLGLETIRFEATGGRISFRTRSAKGGLGEGFDLLVIDEAQEYTDDQESALKYVVSDSRNPQTIFCGTPPTPVSAGTVFTKMRNETLRGERKNTGWAEWSVDAMSDVRNVDLWYETNPSMGAILTERKVEDEITDDVTDFNIQRLGLWLRYNQHSAISRVEWDGLKVETLPELVGPLSIGIKYGHDGAHVAMSIAVRTEDDRIFVEAIDCRSTRSGDAWLLNFLRSAEVHAVVVDGASGQAILAKEMRELHLEKPILPKVAEIIYAYAAFKGGIEQRALCHAGQPSLAEIASNCEKRAIGSSGGFGYRSLRDDLDVALLDSVVLAYWGCTEVRPAVKQKADY